MKFSMNGFEWTVFCVGMNSEKLKRSDGSVTFGMCDREDSAIYISDRLRGGFLRKVIIHEICHSAMFSYGVEMSIKQEELFCDLVATYGAEILEVSSRLFEALSKRNLERMAVI